jgi:transposase
VIADGGGRAIAFRLAPGQAPELPQAVPLPEALPGVPRWVVADRGYTSHRFREHLWGVGARPAIPPRRHEAPVLCPSWVYRNRNRVERLRARLKEGRAIATRYEKTATSFLGVLCLAAAMDWLRRSRALTVWLRNVVGIRRVGRWRHAPGASTASSERRRRGAA